MRTYTVESAVTYSVRAETEAEAERKVLELLREQAAGLDGYVRADCIAVEVREMTRTV